MAPILRRRDFLILSGCAYPFFRSLDGQDALPTTAGLDDFITEKYHDQIFAILAEWSANLLESPRRMQAVEKVLSAGFMGSSMQPVESRLLRSGPMLEVHRVIYEALLGPIAFLQELCSAVSSFSKIMTAELQVTRIDAASDRLHTRVRYDLVGAGHDFYPEQRVGFWDLEWETTPQGQYHLRRWQARDETRTRSAGPCYAEVTPQAFGSNSSYSQQMLRGVDYWRTILDGACRIDIYGHNGVSVGGIDDDGFDDLYVCQPAGLPNRLYRNNGDGTFEDITEASGVGILENTACALSCDFDNDGRPGPGGGTRRRTAVVPEPGRRQVSSEARRV